MSAYLNYNLFDLDILQISLRNNYYPDIFIDIDARNVRSKHSYKHW